ncbi:MAG TPA: amidohydrolase family protein [Caproicibacter sp.]|nr:amidohydrolase family protein [Caproicibacter sp.]
MKTLIVGGTLVDPLNHVHSKLNLLIDGSKIECSTGEIPAADRVIHAEGKIVSPGFIDVHMHEGTRNSDGTLDESIFLALLRMGVTSALGGNCGNNTIDSPSEYLRLVDQAGIPLNLGLFVGHTDSRFRAGGADKYAPIDRAKQNKMLTELERELDGGCIGVSFGLKYTPGTTTEEFRRVCSLCKEKGKPISAHIREDAAGVVEAAREVADAALRLGVQTEVSHIGSMAGFGQMAETLDLLDEYALNGANLGIDCYPYDAFSTEIGETTYDDGWLERYDTDYSSIELCDGKWKGQRCTEQIFRELRKTAPGTITVCHVMKPDEIDLALLHPNVVIVTDGFMHGGQGHPRAAGSYPRFVRNYVRTGKISIDDAIVKMSSLPAQRFGLKNKGRLNAGADADLVIFDPDNIADTATYEDPIKPPVGIDCIMVAGEIAVKDSVVVNGKLGRSLRF